MLTVPTPDQLAGRFTSMIIDPLTGQPFPNNTIPQAVSLASRRLAIAKFFPDAEFHWRREAIIFGIGICHWIRTNTPSAGIRNWAALAPSSADFTNTDYTNTSVGNTTELGDRFFVQKTRNWQVSHSLPFGANLVNQFRFGHVEATADEHGPAAPQSDIDPLD